MKKLLYILGTVLIFQACSQNTNVIEEKWKQTEAILKEIQPPVFADQVFNITNYGAVGDGKTDNTKAIADAIEACHSGGGGKVLVPAGKFFTGKIHLKSNVNLHVEEGAVLMFSTDPEDYKPLVLTSWEGMDCYNYSPLIYAYQQENIAITGKGLLDGMAADGNWWPWKGQAEHGFKPGMPSQLDENGRPKLIGYNTAQVPVEERQMGDGAYLRPHFVQFYECKNILLEDFTIENSPFWIIHPIFSENITVRGLHINSHGPNNDGCNPEGCKNVLIENCYFNTGDDCIALKSGRNQDGRRHGKPIENIIIRNCKMQDGHGGVVIGSEISGGCKNLFVENCEMNSPLLDRAIRIKTNILRGGVVEGIYIRDIQVGEVIEAVVKINLLYEMKGVTVPEDQKYPPIIKDVYINNITSEKSKFGLHITGLDGYDNIENINLSNATLKGVEKKFFIENAPMPNFTNVTINGEQIK
jgi:polygalacturonase